jgi:hypothetical protein
MQLEACLYHPGNALLKSKAIKASEYESLHCPASSSLGIPPISAKSSLLYLYFAQPAVSIIVSEEEPLQNRYSIPAFHSSVASAITKNFLMAPDLTASITLSARAITDYVQSLQQFRLSQFQSEEGNSLRER